MLTQYATVDEAVAGLKKVSVVPVVEKALGIPVEAHFMITEPSGKSAVIEFNNGEMKVFENKLGVITNSPNYDWHLINLRNYINLSSVAVPTKEIQSGELTALGGGSGMIGLPGDFTPPSRFVRIAAFSETARPTATSRETVYELLRILDNFNLGLGAAEGSDISGSDSQSLRSATLWTTALDTETKTFYYHTQHNRRVREINLAQIDFSKLGEAIVHLPLDKDKNEDVDNLTTTIMK